MGSYGFRPPCFKWWKSTKSYDEGAMWSAKSDDWNLTSELDFFKPFAKMRYSMELSVWQRFVFLTFFRLIFKWSSTVMLCYGGGAHVFGGEKVPRSPVTIYIVAINCDGQGIAGRWVFKVLMRNFKWIIRCRMRVKLTVSAQLERSYGSTNHWMRFERPVCCIYLEVYK